MILKEIDIKNFRCFRNLKVELGERATVLFGKNGSGKSTLIHALHKALSFIMYSDKIFVTEKKNGRRKRKVVDVRTITNNNPYLRVEGFSRTGDYNNQDDKLIEIKAKAELEPNLPVDWMMSAYSTNNRLRPSEFIDAFRCFYDWHQKTGNLPLLAYYSDCFPHKEDTKKKTIKKKISSLRNFGYFDWNVIEGCTKEWIDRLENNIFNIRQGKDLLDKLRESMSKGEGSESIGEVIEVKQRAVERWQRENDAIESCLISFSRGLLIGDDKSFEVAGIGIHPEYHDLCIITTRGEEISFVNLPSGYKRLFSIILDIAFRSYILSNEQSTDISGIVIIDEIDLHLHPELENVVLSRLMEVFDNVQFIVSTHSIGVLTSIRSSDSGVKIIEMVKNVDSPEVFHNIYGLDANTGLQEVMGVTMNGEELKRWISQCAYMYAQGLGDQADRLRDFIDSKGLVSTDELNRRIAENLNEING